MLKMSLKILDLILVHPFQTQSINKICIQKWLIRKKLNILLILTSLGFLKLEFIMKLKLF